MARAGITKNAQAESNDVFTKFVGRVDVQPKSQSRLTLGAMPGKGYCIEFSPALPNDEAVKVQFMDTGDAEKHRFVLSMTSHYNKPFSAEVWEM